MKIMLLLNLKYILYDYSYNRTSLLQVIVKKHVSMHESLI